MMSFEPIPECKKACLCFFSSSVPPAKLKYCREESARLSAIFKTMSASDLAS